MFRTIRFQTGILTLILALCTACASMAGGGDEIKGVYENTESNASIEFLGNGKAHLSLYGVGGPCTYKIEGKKLVLTLEDEKQVFTINSDGSLTGPPGTYLSRLTKRKK